LHSPTLVLNAKHYIRIQHDKKHTSHRKSFMHDLVQDNLGMRYGCPKSLQRTHFSYNLKVSTVTIRRGSSRTGML